MAGDVRAEDRDEARKNIMRGREGKLFLSVERFDYTKGILERLRGIEKYLETNPERANMDVFYQIAAASRTDISSYKRYQSLVLSKVDAINQKYSTSPETPVIVVDQSNQPQEIVVRLYQVAEIALITPMADGMNLVIKEAVLCNPNIILVLSTGSGAENQLYDAGLGDSYIRVEDIAQEDQFTAAIQRAAALPHSLAAVWGRKLFAFTKKHDIDYWIESFTNPNWTGQVIQERSIRTTADLQALKKELGIFRKVATTMADNDDHTGLKCALSLQNCLKSLQKSVQGIDASLPGEKGLPSESAGLIRGLKRDIVLFAMNNDRSATENDWVNFCAEVSGMSRSSFDAELETIFSVLERQKPADLLVCNYEILASDEIHQTATSGFLLHRFFARFALETLVVSGEKPMEEILGTTCFPQSFSGGFCAKDKILFGEKIVEKSSSGVREQLQFLFRQDLSMTNWLKRRILILGTTKDAEVAEWLATKEGAIVTLVCVNPKGDVPQPQAVNVFCVSSDGVLFGAAVKFILARVTTASSIQ